MNTYNLNTIYTEAKWSSEYAETDSNVDYELRGLYNNLSFECIAFDGELINVKLKTRSCVVKDDTVLQLSGEVLNDNGMSFGVCELPHDSSEDES